MKSSPSDSAARPGASSATWSPTACWPGIRCWIPRRNVHGQCRGIAGHRFFARARTFGIGIAIARRGVLRRIHHLLDLFGRCRAAAPRRRLRTGSRLRAPERGGMHRLRRAGHVDRRTTEKLKTQKIEHYGNFGIELRLVLDQVSGHRHGAASSKLLAKGIVERIGLPEGDLVHKPVGK